MKELKELSTIEGNDGTIISFYEGGEVSSYWVEHVEDDERPSWHSGYPTESSRDYDIFIDDLNEVAEEHPEVYIRVYNHIKCRKEQVYTALAEYCKKGHNRYIDSLYDFIKKNPKFE